jgi:hypothetical protein
MAGCRRVGGVRLSAYVRDPAMGFGTNTLRRSAAYHGRKQRTRTIHALQFPGEFL